MPLSFFLALEVGPLTLFLALMLGLLMCFPALTLVAFRTLSISFHATLQCSNPHVPSLEEYLIANSRLRERQARSFAEWRVHLGYALDLSLLAPSAVIAGVLLWRGSLWGNAMATVVLVFLCVFQLNFLSAAVFMNDAGIPNTASAIPLATTSMLLFGVPAVVMLWGVTGLSQAPRVQQEHQPA